MQPIDQSKSSPEQKAPDTANVPPIDTKEAVLKNKNDSQSAPAITEKQAVTIGLLLKQTLQHLKNEGLLSIDIQKAMLSTKKILPGEYTQLFIQDRVQQHQLAINLSRQLNNPISLSPKPLTLATTEKWFSGQLLQTIVYQKTLKGVASLLVNATGQFDSQLLSQLLSQTQKNPNQPQLETSLLSNKLISQAQLVNIKTSLNLFAGQQLLLQVNKNNAEMTFHLQHSPHVSQQVNQFINQYIEKQQALPQLLASLKEISTQTHQTNAFFTPPFKQQVDKLIQQLPLLSQLNTGQEVKSALYNSGPFLENKLLASSPLPGADFKAVLSQLVHLIIQNQAVQLPQQLSPHNSLYSTIAHESLLAPQKQINHFFEAPGRILHAQVQPPVKNANLFQLGDHLLLQTKILDQLEGVLARIIVNQLHLREGGGEQQTLSFEVPFKHNDQQEILQLKIRQELKEKEAQKGHKIWTVNLAFHLESLGGIRIYITLDDNNLDIQFWTEEQSSQKLFEKYFHLLNERLTDAGYTLTQLKAFHGIPEKAQEEQKYSQFIIDERV